MGHHLMFVNEQKYVIENGPSVNFFLGFYISKGKSNPYRISCLFVQLSTCPLVCQDSLYRKRFLPSGN